MDEKKKKYLSILTGCLLSLLFILVIFSPQNVDPLRTDWVKNGGGDNFQHYLGWRFFRNDGWTRYILFMRNLNYPVGTSVIVTDSNPLFCLLLKPFRSVLPDEFQFNGIWIVLSYLLTAFFSGIICWQLTRKAVFTIAGTLIAILNPVVMQRSLIHDTLTAHWLILAAVWLMMNFEKRWNTAAWFLLTEITLLIHIYFIPMIAFVLLLQIIRMITKKQPIIKILMPAVVFTLALVLGYFGFGYSHILPQTGSYGELSMNLNAFINPDSIPSILPSRLINPLQYEGFNYWGIGLLLIVLFAALIAGRKKLMQFLPFLLPCLFLIAAAASNDAYFDQKLIWHFEIPEWINSWLSVFRSSGRLVWPLYYLVLFASLYLLAGRSKNERFVEIIIVLCVILQSVDLHGFHRETAERFRNPANILPELPEALVSSIPEGTSHLYSSDGDSKIVDALALFAADHHMSFNRNANARNIEHIYGGDPLAMASLSCDQIRPDSVYIYLSGNAYPPALDYCENIELSKISDLVVITKKPSSP